MAEEEKTDQEQPEEAPDAEAPEAEAPVEEPAAEEAPAEEADAETPAEAPEAEVEDAPAPPTEPEEELTPKQRRKLERSRAPGPAGPPRTPEERAAARSETRRAKAAARRRWRHRERGKRERGDGTPPAERRPGTKRVREGTVVSNKADKTITVRIEVARRHPTYEKIVRRSATVHAHDERNEANEGDRVRVIESRPLSRTKRWRLIEILERAR
jgi:small subunit ribosomal protein S17